MRMRKKKHTDDRIASCGKYLVEDPYSMKGKWSELAGDKKGLARYGYMILPMDEALILSAVDLSGRAYLGFDAEMPTPQVGTFDTELVEEFWLAFVREARITLHIGQLAGNNTHHIIEGIFKSVAHSLKKALTPDEALAGTVLSTKEVL